MRYPTRKRSSHSKDAKWAVASEQGGKSTEESNADAPHKVAGNTGEEFSMAKSARLPPPRFDLGRPLQSRSRCLFRQAAGSCRGPAPVEALLDRPPFGRRICPSNEPVNQQAFLRSPISWSPVFGLTLLRPARFARGGLGFQNPCPYLFRLPPGPTSLNASSCLRP